MKKSFIQLHIAVFLAGFTGPLGRLIQLNEGLLVWYRLLITAGTMWLIFSFTKKLQPIPIKDIFRLSAVGLLSALHWVAFYGSVKSSNVSVALVCFSSVGFFTALIEPVLGRKKMNWIELFLGVLVMAGIYIIFHFDPKYKTGILLGVACAVLLAFSVIFLRSFIQRMNPETALTWQLSGAFIYLTVLMPLYLYYFPTHYIIPDFNDWMWLLFLGWICSVLAFLLTGYSLKKLTAFTVNLSFNLEPVYGIILAFILFGESKEWSWSFFLGFAFIAVSLVLHVIFLLKQEKKLESNAIN
ncbi:MAG: DMT family transporter [Bacteroidetes bacterium]|nr:DMT family transporter [Bacteroidota bacterium]MBS1634259.1 DMT family transporter [Bacteroidota bacterium]